VKPSPDRSNASELWDTDDPPTDAATAMGVVSYRFVYNLSFIRYYTSFVFIFILYICVQGLRGIRRRPHSTVISDDEHEVHITGHIESGGDGSKKWSVGKVRLIVYILMMHMLIYTSICI
jgi:hypothetical protein